VLFVCKLYMDFKAAFIVGVKIITINRHAEHAGKLPSPFGVTQGESGTDIKCSLPFLFPVIFIDLFICFAS